MRRSVATLLLALGSISAGAQLLGPGQAWQEAEAPPPPALQPSRVIPVEVPRATLRYGVDPASITVGPDRVVRYVVVATSDAGAVNGLYEGVRCGTAEVKVYARHHNGSGWLPVRDAAWQSLHNGAATRHSLLIARSGVCQGQAPNGSPQQIARDLRLPMDERFGAEGR